MDGIWHLYLLCPGPFLYAEGHYWRTCQRPFHSCSFPSCGCNWSFPLLLACQEVRIHACPVCSSMSAPCTALETQICCTCRFQKLSPSTSTFHSLVFWCGGVSDKPCSRIYCVLDMYHQAEFWCRLLILNKHVFLAVPSCRGILQASR